MGLNMLLNNVPNITIELNKPAVTGSIPLISLSALGKNPVIAIVQPMTNIKPNPPIQSDLDFVSIRILSNTDPDSLTKVFLGLLFINITQSNVETMDKILDTT